MPSVNSKERAIYLAVGVAACAGCLMGVGSLLLYQRLRRDARGFVEPLRRDLVALRRELEELRRIVETLREYQPPAKPTANKALSSVVVAEDIAGALYQQHVTGTPSTGSIQDEDLAEFYDARSDVLSSPDYDSPFLSHSTSNGALPTANQDLEAVYKRADVLVAYEKDFSVEDRKEAYELVKSYYKSNQSNYEYLWHLARVTYLYGRALMDVDEAKRKELCFEAKKYAFDALALNDKDAEVHKWCALTIGTLGDFVGITQKLKDGLTFKVHIDKALELKKSEAVLYHLSGRWYYGVADLSWLERNAAKMIVGELPQASYEDALAGFLQAERLKPQWKENLLYIALCYHNLGDKEQTREYLAKAQETRSESLDDASAEKEIEKLWLKYGS